MWYKNNILFPTLRKSDLLEKKYLKKKKNSHAIGNIVKLDMLLLLVSFSPTILYLKAFTSIITNHSFVFGKKKRRNELHKLSLHLSFQCFSETMLCCTVRNCRQIHEDTSISRSNKKPNNKNDGKLTNTLPLERYLLTSVLKYKSEQAVKYKRTFKIYDRFKNGRAEFCRKMTLHLPKRSWRIFSWEKKKDWKENKTESLWSLCFWHRWRCFFLT